MAETYTERFAALVTEIVANVKGRKTCDSLRYAYGGVGYDLVDRSQRMALIERVADGYIKAHADVNQATLDAWRERGCNGERPSPISLDTALIERLTDAILDEELTDPNPYKVSHEEYPFMSDRQLDLRRDRETGLKAVEETGMDGRDYRKPTKRRRTNYENWHVDHHARGRNKERQRQYAKDTAAGPVSYGRSAAEFVTAASVAKKWRERLSLVY